MTDLTTEAGILEWARPVEADGFYAVGPNRDRATAAKLARAMRLLECVEEMEHMGEDGTKEGRDIADGWNACVNTLRAAMEEPTDGR